MIQNMILCLLASISGIWARARGVIIKTTIMHYFECSIRRSQVNSSTKTDYGTPTMSFNNLPQLCSLCSAVSHLCLLVFIPVADVPHTAF